MLVTSDQAKELLCPLAIANYPTILQGSFNPDIFTCTGCGCMAWRFSAGDFVENTFPPIPLGYCGLAGKP